MKTELIEKLIEMLVKDEKSEKSDQVESDNLADDLIGKRVIIRSHDSGCHFGVLKGVSGRHVSLADSRRMWSWWSAKEMTLSAVAKFGLNESKSLKIQSEVERIEILDACEIILCSQDCIDSFDRVEPYNEQ
jgi:hypothetical protein